MCTSLLGRRAFSLANQSEWTVPSEEILLIVRSNFLIYHVTEKVMWHTLSKSESLLNAIGISTHAIYAYAFQQIILSITVKLNALYTLLQNKKNAKNQKIVIFRRLSVVEV